MKAPQPIPHIRKLYSKNEGRISFSVTPKELKTSSSSIRDGISAIKNSKKENPLPLVPTFNMRLNHSTTSINIVYVTVGAESAAMWIRSTNTLASSPVLKVPAHQNIMWTAKTINPSMYIDQNAKMLGATTWRISSPDTRPNFCANSLLFSGETAAVAAGSSFAGLASSAVSVVVSSSLMVLTLGRNPS